MTSRPRCLAVLLFALAVAVSACGASAEPSGAPPEATEPLDGTAPAPGLETPLVVEVTPQPSTAPLDGQTETEWGRIWDSVPAGFPEYPDTVVTDEATRGPASAVYVGPKADAEEMAIWFQGALEKAAFSTEALSGPLEDGGYVIDSVGEVRGCRLEVTISPLGGTSMVTVLYGADCPHP